MAHTVTILSQTPNSAAVQLDEDGTAAALVQTDLVAALNDGPLKDALSQEFADQAAARAALYNAIDVNIYANQIGAGAVQGIADANVSGTGEGNFRLETNVAKAAGTDTATLIARIALRHSIIA